MINHIALLGFVKIKVFHCVVALLLSELMLGFPWITLRERHIFTTQVCIYNRFYL